MKWITREKIKVDRVACPWLIQHFVDPQAEFLFLPHDTDWSKIDNGAGGSRATWTGKPARVGELGSEPINRSPNADGALRRWREGNELEVYSDPASAGLFQIIGLANLGVVIEKQRDEAVERSVDAGA